MSWLDTHWPNQIIRATHHNGVFLNDPEGTGSIGQYSTEPLEGSNKWVKMFNDHQTWRGDRKKALKGIFKLRRLKSSYRLKKALPDNEKRIYHCTVCGQEDHNKTNKVMCPGTDNHNIQEQLFYLDETHDTGEEEQDTVDINMA